MTVAGPPGRRVASHVPLGAGRQLPAHLPNPRGPGGWDGDHPITRVAVRDLAVGTGRWWLVRRVRARHPLPPRCVGRRRLSTTSGTGAPLRVQGPCTDPSFAAALCGEVLRSSFLTRATTHCPLRSSVPPGHPATSEHPTGSDGAAPGPAHGRPRGLPCGDLTLAGSSHLGPGTFPIPRRWAGAHHLHLEASARGSLVTGRGSVVRSRPARSTLRSCHPWCPGFGEKSQDDHRMSTGVPQDVPRSCPAGRTVGASARAVEGLWTVCPGPPHRRPRGRSSATAGSPTPGSAARQPGSVAVGHSPCATGVTRVTRVTRVTGATTSIDTPCDVDT